MLTKKRQVPFRACRRTRCYFDLDGGKFPRPPPDLMPVLLGRLAAVGRDADCGFDAPEDLDCLLTSSPPLVEVQAADAQVEAVICQQALVQQYKCDHKCFSCS